MNTILIDTVSTVTAERRYLLDLRHEETPVSP
jgi:hypothetical protein